MYEDYEVLNEANTQDINENKEQINDADEDSLLNNENTKVSLWDRFMKIPYDEIPDALKNRAYITLFSFGGLGLLTLIFGLYNSVATSFRWMAVALIVFAVANSVHILFEAGRDKFVEIEGVIINKEKKGIRRGEYNAYVQVPEGDVYKIYLTSMYKDFQKGNILRFYIINDGSMYYKDGVYNVSTMYALERLSAKITSDDEDDYINDEDVLDEEEI